TAVLSDLKNPLFDDDQVIPGGAELRAVLGFQQQAHEEYPDLPASPIVEMKFVSGDVYAEVDHTTRKVMSRMRMSAADRRKFIAMVPLEDKPGGYRALIHRDAVVYDPIFKKDPYVFWTNFNLHEIAEYSLGVSHEVLAKAGL